MSHKALDIVKSLSTSCSIRFHSRNCKSNSTIL